MSKKLLILLFLLSFASASAFAQRGGGGGGGGGGDDSGGGGGGRAGGGGGGMGGGAPASGPTNPKAKSDAETAAIKDLSTVYNDPATTSDQMDAAIAAFIAKYPKSEFLFQVNRLGVEFNSNPKHVDVSKTVAYATKALKIVPADLKTLYEAGTAVPQFEKSDDPNLADNLRAADEWNNKVITTVRLMPDSGGGRRGGGATQTPDEIKAQALKMKQQKDQLAYGAYVGLARSATLQKKYVDAQADFDKALTMADWDPDHGDLVHAETYFYQAQAQEAAQKWSDAAASLDQASKLDTASPALQKMVGEEQAKLKAGGH